MKKHKFKLIFAIIAVIIIIILIWNNKSKAEEVSTEYSETQVIKTDILNTLSSSSYVTTGLEEKKELHTTYYFEEIYFDTNEIIPAGENILKYTNGTYLTAPYNCVITEMSLPETEAVCTNKHYITIQSTDTLEMTMQVSEDELDTVYVGQEAMLEVEALENKQVTGYVTDISNTANYSSSGSTFDITVVFQNDGEILLGMSAKCSIILEKAEDVLAVAVDAVNENRNQKYVIVEKDGVQTEVEIETGIENDAYVEIKSGLNEGDTVLIEESDSSMQNNMRQNMQMNRGGNSGMQQGGERPSMPSGNMGIPPKN